MNPSDLLPEGAAERDELLNIGRPGEEPIFAEPWQAYAFALAVSLSRQGHFTWSEWSHVFGAERKASALRRDPDNGAAYFHCWLSALERLVIDRKLADAASLAELKNAWADAYRRTPHGQPVELKNGVG